MSLLTRSYQNIVISRPSRGRSTSSVTYTTFNIKGSFQPIDGREVFRKGKGGESATHRLYTDITTNLVYGDKASLNGQEYVVIFAIQPNGISGRGHHKEFVCEVFE